MLDLTAMEKETDNTVAGSEEFCSLMDALIVSIRDHRDDEDEKRQACLEYASCMRRREYQVGDDKREKAWPPVEEILQSWIMAALCRPNIGSSRKNRILIINDILGPGIALRLYTYYVRQCDRCGCEPELLIPLGDLIPMFRHSGISDEEGEHLYRLTRTLSSAALASTLA